MGITANCMPPIAPLLRNTTFKWSSLSSCFTIPFQRLYQWSKKSDDTQTTSYSSRSIQLGTMSPKYDSTDARETPRYKITQTRCFTVEPLDESISVEDYAQARPASIPARGGEGGWI